MTGARSKLTPEAVTDIKARAARGQKHEVIARHHGIARSYVSMVVRGLRPKGTTASVIRHAAIDGGERIYIPANVDGEILMQLGRDLFRRGETLAAQARRP